jgi:hypothetical protein
MSVLDPNWKYTNAEDSKKPGYLAKRFEVYRKRQEKDKKELATVLPIAKRKQK